MKNGLTCVADFYWQLVVIVAYKRHVAKDGSVVSDMTDMAKVVLWIAYHARGQLLC